MSRDIIRRLRCPINSADDIEEYFRAGVAAADEIERLCDGLRPSGEDHQMSSHETEQWSYYRRIADHRAFAHLAAYWFWRLSGRAPA